MAIVKGTNCGFVSVAPTADPAAAASQIDDRAYAVKDTSPAAAVKVTEIGWWCDNATEEANFEVAIYDHNVGDDEPENKVEWSQTHAKGTSSGWKRATGLNIVIVPETIYWVAVQVDDTASRTDKNYVADGGELRADKTAVATLTDPWGATTTAGQMIAIYAVTAEAGGGGDGQKSGGANRDLALGEEKPGIRI